MEKYVKPQMEVIEFEAEDVITTSCSVVLEDWGCGSKGTCFDYVLG